MTCAPPAARAATPRAAAGADAATGAGAVTDVAAAAGVVREPIAGVAVRFLTVFDDAGDAVVPAASPGRSDLRTIL